MKPSIVYSSPFHLLRISCPERSTKVADLSRGTAHVEGSDVTISRSSTESLEVIFTALSPILDLSMSHSLPFPVFIDFWFFFLTDTDDVESRNSISGETECDPKAHKLINIDRMEDLNFYYV